MRNFHYKVVVTLVCFYINIILLLQALGPKGIFINGVVKYLFFKSCPPRIVRTAKLQGETLSSGTCY